MKELTRAQRRDIRNLVTTMCANYDREHDCCPLLDDYGCYVFTKAFADNKLCRYFREAVLPLNSILEATLTRKPVHTKPCIICGKQFALSGRQVYCSLLCETLGNRIKSRARMQKRREKAG